MLLSLNEVRDVDVHATDGPIGRVEECLFDDEQWTIRYIVVDAVDLIGRRVLISPIAVARPGSDRDALHVSLSTDQIRHSPGIEDRRPVSRQFERAYGNYYGYPPYWIGSGYWGAGPNPAALLRKADRAAPQAAVSEEESHLRSSGEVTGYHIEAADGSIGHVDDFLIDDTTWVIEFLRLDTSNFIGGKAVLVPRQALRDVRWPDRTIDVALTKDEVRTSPEYDPEMLRTEGWGRRSHHDSRAR